MRCELSLADVRKSKFWRNRGLTTACSKSLPKKSLLISIIVVNEQDMNPINYTKDVHITYEIHVLKFVNVISLEN